ncbi:MAG: hypothetical protein JJU28_10420 [Cyclobacteriaceae bacterium]|nr:hypothetical protein [Cyclobacteriaceae bacterium]
MNDWFRKATALGYLLLCFALQGRAKVLNENLPLHPRVLVKADEVPALREKMKVAPFNNKLEDLKASCNERQHLLQERDKLYDIVELAADLAGLYLLTGDAAWAEKSYQAVDIVLNDTVYFRNPVSRGLTRAALLMRTAIAYDFCYTAWNEQQRHKLNEALYDVMVATNSNMGTEANYSIASNWMGVRFGAVIVANLAIDHKSQKLLKPFLWDATNRLEEHIEQNFFSNGWNAESLGYFAYGYSFSGLALVALKNHLASFSLFNFAPKLRNSIHGLATSYTSSSENTKADLSDDNLGGKPMHVLSLAFDLFPEAQHPYIKWVSDYLMKDDLGVNNLLYWLIFTPKDIVAINPVKPGWLNYHDPEQGIAIFRNRFQDQNDIVATYSATARRVRGHSGHDTNAFRLIGLDAAWIIGAGRTGEVAGQSHLFPEGDPAGMKGEKKSVGILRDFHFNNDDSGSGWAMGEGSSVGTKNHHRYLRVDYSRPDIAEAVIVLKDRSENGHRMRFAVPEYHDVQIHENGFTLTAPNGASLNLTFDVPQVKIQKDKVRYGGSTSQHNPGIQYYGEKYEYAHVIDCFTGKDFTALITLQQKNKKHPNFKVLKNNRIRVGDLMYTLPQER